MAEIRSRLSRCWDALWHRPSRWFTFGIPLGAVVAFVFGILFWGGFNTALEMTMTEQFCISCHEMRDNTYSEYLGTIHDKNRTGVRATCPDCHVPHPWLLKMETKIAASNELLHSILGTIDTPEKFEAHRLDMAKHQWEIMKASDSRECRNCHSFAAMDADKQDPTAAKRHSAAYIAETGKTCIDCHKGIAHHLPKIG